MFLKTLVAGREDREGKGKDDLRKLRHGMLIMAVLAQWMPNALPILCYSFCNSLICQNSSLYNQTPVVPVAKTQTRHAPDDFQCPPPLIEAVHNHLYCKIQMMKTKPCTKGMHNIL